VPPADLGPLYAGAAVVAYPSLREGFGLPPLEAMAQGAAVVTSRGTATEEVAGDAAVLVDPTSVTDIAAGLDRVLSDRAGAVALGERARTRSATYTWERTAELTVAAYREVVG
jgi:glycosyltransferase involved in cell wall biosynthesis